MTKHRWRDSVKSFFGNHIDPEKDEQLKGEKKEIEDKVQKIYKLIKDKDDDGNEGDAVGNSKKERLLELIEDFHQHYDSLYAHYDHLTGELRKKVHQKQENGNSSSSSSDSDSDHSFRKKGRKNGKVDNEFQIAAEGIKHELETANLEVADLKRKLAATVEEKDALHFEYQTALKKNQESEIMILELKVEAERLHDEKSKLLLEHSDLNLKLEAAGILEAELNQKLEVISRENIGLILEKETAIKKIEEGEKITEELRATISQFTEERESLQLQLEAVRGELSVVKGQLESAEHEVATLSQSQKATEEENRTLSSKVLDLSNEIKEAQDRIQEVVTESSQLMEKLDERERAFSTHTEMQEAHKSETSSRLRGFELELDSLHTQKRELEKQKDDELSTLLNKLEDKERDSLAQIEFLTAQVNNLQHEVESIETIKAELEQQIRVKSEEASNQVKDLTDQVNEKQRELASLQIQKIESESQLEKRVREISEFVVVLETLKTELSNKTEDQHKTLEENEGLMVLVNDLELDVNSLNNQKIELEERLSSKTSEYDHLKEEKEGLQNRIVELERTLADKDNEFSELRKQFGDTENETSARIITLLAQVNGLQLEAESLETIKAELEQQIIVKSEEAANQVKDLTDQVNEKQRELASLQIQKIESESQLEKRVREISEFVVMIETLKTELSNKTEDQHKTLEENEGLMVLVKDLELDVNSLNNQKIELEERLRSKTSEHDHLKEEKEGLQNRIVELERTLADKDNEFSELRKQFGDTENETSARIITLQAQVNCLQLEADSLSALKTESESQLQKKIQEISDYVSQIENLKEELASKTVDGQRILEEKDGLMSTVKDLELAMESLHTHRSELEVQVRDKDIAGNQLREETEGLKAKSSELEKILVEGGDELIALQKKLEEVENDKSAQIEKLQLELDSLKAEKSQLELLIETGKRESSESLTEVENQKIELTRMITDQQILLKEKENAFNKLSEEHKHVQVLFAECKTNLQVAEKKIEEMAEELDKSTESKDQKIDDLEESVEDLKRDLEIKGDEHSTLVENVRNIEVKLRLSNQKLRITEQLLTENEEIHKKKEEKFIEENKSLKERISVLGGIIAAYKEAQVKMIAEISEKVNGSTNGIETLTIKFEEDFGHFETRVYEIINEVQVAKHWVKATNGEREKLKKEIINLVEQLRDTKQHESVLREKVRELETKLQKDEKEKKSLVEDVKRLEERMGELEKMMREKEEVFLGLGEEKREAIRQLCVWIEYHRDRCDYLKEALSKVSGRRRQITA